MKIAILGTRGIPNKYGGFEQFAEKVSVGLAQKGHQVSVYNPHFHEFQESEFQGVNIIHKYSPESKIGAAANFVYDYLCLKDALKRDFDIILECGYQSASFAYYLCSIKKSVLVTNMDGMEWKRAKWSGFVKKMTRRFEKWGALKSHALVSDNDGIKDYLLETYGKDSVMIPYGATIFESPNFSKLAAYGVEKHNYFLIIARLEPENNVEPALDGYAESGRKEPFLVVGNHNTAYGELLKEKYKDRPEIKFLNGIYDEEVINNLRYFSKLYFHGHSVGGTNPSLLEAMACSALIIAHDNAFNKSVLQENGLYFSSANAVKEHLDNMQAVERNRLSFANANKTRIREIYSWEIIVGQYETFFKKLLKNKCA